jgi:hypothetical protein
MAVNLCSRKWALGIVNVTPVRNGNIQCSISLNNSGVWKEHITEI